MLNISYSDTILKAISKIKDKTDKEKIKKQIFKIIKNPEISKPMRFTRKGTRELYVGPYRIAYSYLKMRIKLYY